jgi:hypothetical protein
LTVIADKAAFTLPRLEKRDLEVAKSEHEEVGIKEEMIRSERSLQAR